VRDRRVFIEPSNRKISVRRQCELLDLHRSGVYYASAGESEKNRRLMEVIDRIYTENPSWGSRRITAALGRLVEYGGVNRKRVSRLMRKLGIAAIYPKPRTSVADKSHGKYPYLLNGLNVKRSNQVWCADITYIPTKKGFVYLVAIMDWNSRYVLSWELSNSMESSFCVKALESAIASYGAPEIFNSDQGSQFTDHRFTGVLESYGVKLSMDGKGRCMDNIFIERLWRTLKYEEVYMKEYPTLPEARTGIGNYLRKYNRERPHQSLGYQTPWEAYVRNGGKDRSPETGAIFLKSAASWS